MIEINCKILYFFLYNHLLAEKNIYIFFWLNTKFYFPTVYNISKFYENWWQKITRV